MTWLQAKFNATAKSLVTFLAQPPQPLQGAAPGDSSRIIAELQEKNRKLQEKVRALNNQVEDLKGNIRVFVRVRPLSDSDGSREPAVTAHGRRSVAYYNDLMGQMIQREYTTAYGPEVTQEDVFGDIAPLVDNAMDGSNVSILAYGQTGSGKTHTMLGVEGSPGVTPRAIKHVFKRIKDAGGKMDYTVQVYMVQIYNEQLLDLLTKLPSDKKDLSIVETKGGVAVQGATLEEVATVEEFQEILQRGQENRAKGQTRMNQHSSRSHMVTALIITAKDRKTRTVCQGKLSLVDLAGSERPDKSGAKGAQLEEAIAINLSLSHLSTAILNVVGGNVVDYRGKKLTHLLKDSLGGNSKTLMFVNVSPCESSLGETKCSLDFADCARKVKNVAKRDEAHETTEKPRRQAGQQKRG